MAYLNGNEILFGAKALLGGSNGVAETVIEKNNETSLRFWVGTQAEYDAIEEKDGNCFYIISDDGDKDEIYQRLNNLENRDYIVETGFAAATGVATSQYYEKYSNGIIKVYCKVNCPRLSGMTAASGDVIFNDFGMIPGTHFNVSTSVNADLGEYANYRLSCEHVYRPEKFPDRITVLVVSAKDDELLQHEVYEAYISLVGRWK